MPIIYLSPSTQEWNPYVDGGNEEYYMNLIADAMEPYLRANGIQFVRNTPDMTAASSIRASNAGNYDLHVALHSNAAPVGKEGQVQGCLLYTSDENDPVFCTTDLLPHLAANQSKRTLSEGIQGEELNILIGSMPIKDDKVGDKVKLNILKILNEKYGIVESDFLSAELTAVPREKAKDLGFDRSMIGSYGHDDRVCAYPALIAEFEAKTPEYTTVTVLTDKEEVGSDGNTCLLYTSFIITAVNIAL